MDGMGHKSTGSSHPLNQWQDYVGDLFVPKIGLVEVHAFKGVLEPLVHKKLRADLRRVLANDRAEERLKDIIMTVVDPSGEERPWEQLSRPDDPLVWISPGFEEYTGYQHEWALGRNCRFLQPKDFNRNQRFNGDQLHKLRKFCLEGRKSSPPTVPTTLALLLNERRTVTFPDSFGEGYLLVLNGSPFWNLSSFIHVEVNEKRYIVSVMLPFLEERVRFAELLSDDPEALEQQKRLKGLLSRHEGGAKFISLEAVQRQLLSVFFADFPMLLQAPSVRSPTGLEVPIFGLEVSANNTQVSGALKAGVRHVHILLPSGPTTRASDGSTFVRKILPLKLAEVLNNLQQQHLHYLREAMVITVRTPPHLVFVLAEVRKTLATAGYSVACWFLDVRGCTPADVGDHWQAISQAKAPAEAAAVKRYVLAGTKHRALQIPQLVHDLHFHHRSLLSEAKCCGCCAGYLPWAWSGPFDPCRTERSADLGPERAEREEAFQELFRRYFAHYQKGQVRSMPGLLPHEIPIQYEFEVPKNMYDMKMTPELLLMRGGISSPDFALGPAFDSGSPWWRVEVDGIGGKHHQVLQGLPEANSVVVRPRTVLNSSLPTDLAKYLEKLKVPASVHKQSFQFTLGVPLEHIPALLKRMPQMHKRQTETSNFCRQRNSPCRDLAKILQKEERERLVEEVLQLFGGDRPLYPKGIMDYLHFPEMAEMGASVVPPFVVEEVPHLAVPSTPVATLPGNLTATPDFEELLKQDPEFATALQARRRQQLGMELPGVKHFLSKTSLVSLGSYCAVANMIQKLGLREAAGPFDWIRSNGQGDFLDWEGRVHDVAGLQVFPTTWGGSFWHHDISDLQVRQTFDRRKERFLQMRNENLLFVRVVNGTQELAQIPDLYSALHARFSAAGRDSEREIRTQDLGSNVIFACCHHAAWEAPVGGSLPEEQARERLHLASDAYAAALSRALYLWCGYVSVKPAHLAQQLVPWSCPDAKYDSYQPYRSPPLAMAVALQATLPSIAPIPALSAVNLRPLHPSRITQVVKKRLGPAGAAADEMPTQLADLLKLAARMLENRERVDEQLRSRPCQVNAPGKPWSAPSARQWLQGAQEGRDLMSDHDSAAAKASLSSTLWRSMGIFLECRNPQSCLGFHEKSWRQLSYEEMLKEAARLAQELELSAPEFASAGSAG
eukprot:s1296_g13.t1